ncbi:MAG: DUF1501 domain-containing protein [Deltaproteobacteria bacterium]|nr:DUF1501 domain-containing protein [Deltaproteobacteria bacterium]
MSSRHSRRAILQGGGVAALALGTGLLPGFAQRALAEEAVARDAGPARKKVFCFLFLRGALDGLMALQPLGDPRLQELRPQLALLPPGMPSKGAQSAPLVSLGDSVAFAAHPSLAPLLPLWQQGHLAFVHAVGSPDPTRSHFDAQDMLELGTPGRTSTPEGFLTRALTLAPAQEPRSPLEVVALSARAPRSLQGEKGALAFSGVDQLRLRPQAGTGGNPGRAASREVFQALYGEGADRVSSAGQQAFAAVDLLEKKTGRNGPQTDERARYPGGPMGNSLKQLAQLIKADVGLRVGCLDAGGWDTHAGEPGVLQRLLGELAAGLSAFWLDLGERAADVTLVAATEFGRTARQNGAVGTDHCHGSVALVLGGDVVGGEVHGLWPGLRDDQLYEQRDLAVTTDLRAVLASALTGALGPIDLARVFPGFTGAPMPGLIRA